MDDENEAADLRVRPKSSRSQRVPHDELVAEKRNKEALSLVRQMSARNNMLTTESEESFDDENEIDDDDDDVQAPLPEGRYDPREFEHITAPPEIKQLFQYVTKYCPQNIELDYKLAPFVPDFIPAVGDIDAFIKIARPDGLDSDVGLVVLDEPCTKQSDPAVLHLQLRAATKQSSAKRVIVKQVENASKNHKSIDRWIKDIDNLHKSKHSSTFMYTSQMPDIDTLMQEWPADFQKQIENLGLPGRDMDCDLATYIDIVCGLLDIPVEENTRIEALHLLFNLYAAVKNSSMKADPATSSLNT